MEGVKAVRQLDNTHLHWEAQIAGKPNSGMLSLPSSDQMIESPVRARTGADNAGVVTFHRLSDRTSRIMLQMDYETEGAMGAVALRVAGDLERFKEFMSGKGGRKRCKERRSGRQTINPRAGLLPHGGGGPVRMV
ncbi:MAG: cyclase/dehydrase [Nitrospira sp.]|nr:cyclase/dehydrase [Nitrospira sp.]